MINQSSAVLCFSIPKRLTSLAATNMLASMNVVVVTMNTLLLRELFPLMVDIVKVFPLIAQLMCCIRYQVMADGDSKHPLGIHERILVRLLLCGVDRRPAIYRNRSSGVSIYA